MKIEKYTEQLTRLSNEDKYVGDFANNTERDTFMSENIDADIAWIRLEKKVSQHNTKSYTVMAKIKLIKGDITVSDTDAIVNAANSSLLGGGGVDGAIHRKGGPKILEECIEIRNRQGGCKTGEAVYTSGGLLPCRYLIHTVGPIWNGGKKKERELLSNCYHNSLKIANDLNLATIAFPNISTGIYLFPKQEAAEIAIQTVQTFLNTENKTIQEVTFVCFDDENYEIYEKLI